jgi:alpha-glucosidase
MTKLSLPRVLALFISAFCFGVRVVSAAAPSMPQLQSPDGRIVVDIRVGDRISYDVLIDERVVLKDSRLALHLEHVTFGPGSTLKAVTPRTHDGTINPPIRIKAASLREHYNELRLELEGRAAVTFRAYNEGVAYRWETSLPAAEVKVMNEHVAFNFTGSNFVYYPEEQSFFSHNERLFMPRALDDIAPHNLASIPAVVETGALKIAITDADVESYPGLWLRGTSAAGLTGAFPPYPLKEELTGDRDLRIVESANYIAKTTGTRTYPWRVMAVAYKDGDLIMNALVYLLASPSRIADTSWIKPGKVAWDWWNANNLFGVDFKAGINNQTYKHYINFAAANGLSYIILDEGWYKLGNVLDVVPEIDVEELVAYGKEKNVGIILWVIWKTLDDQLTPALDQFVKWGVRGIKVDFMQRDDQPIMDYYHKIAREAAQRKLLVDFHGAIRPALLTRTWPNLISTEGVRGNEWNKWSTHITPEHNTTLPFTRMLLGPMDYTPGATQNASRVGFSFNHYRPSSQGTRCHQLALYVVFESPLQMLADSPSHYAREPEMLKFLRAVPTEWDETKVLDAKMADYVLIARRRGAEWFVGAITDWSPRELELDFSFLPEGKFRLELWQDGINALHSPHDFKMSEQSVTRATKLKLQLAEGGGWAGRLRAE